MNPQITIQAVKGGFILTTMTQDPEAGFQSEQEVFTTSGKLIKAIRGLIEPAAGDKDTDADAKA